MKTILVDAVGTFIIEEQGVFQPMFELLEKYSNQKIILTNADYEKDNKYGLNDMPYKVFTLKHNPEKTDAKFFETMLKHFNLDSKDVVYFEHNSEAVKSARSVGITSYFYDPDKKDLGALKNFLDENLLSN